MLVMNPNPVTQSSPGSQGSSADTEVDIPAWTTLAGTTDTSDKEDALREDEQKNVFQRASPRPSVKRNGSRTGTPAQGSRSGGGPRRRFFNPSQTFTVVEDFNSAAEGDSNSPMPPASTGLPLLWVVPPQADASTDVSSASSKRKVIDSITSTENSSPKKRKRVPSSQASQPSAPQVAVKPLKSPNKPLTIHYSSLVAKLQETAPSDATSSGQMESASTSSHTLQASTSGLTPSRGVRGAAPSFPNHHLRPPKPLPSSSDDWSTAEWDHVDEALQTHVSPVRVQNAQSPKDDAVDETRLHVALRHLAFDKKESKGKERAQLGWTVPRWSKVAEFKERLDAYYGPGDINRGLGRGPLNVSAVLPLAVAMSCGAIGRAERRSRANGYTITIQSKIPVADDDGSACVFDIESIDPFDGTALTEDEDDRNTLLQGMRRGRLENPSPGKGTLDARRHHAQGNSPEIV
ncbi:hypothetical protein C8Q74DRAFT_1266343 [Fomes fomentarius]|nr:hypothetical protein C8Q74DRAFT_1266343 [Fomes fomentarius]